MSSGADFLTNSPSDDVQYQPLVELGQKMAMLINDSLRNERENNIPISLPNEFILKKNWDRITGSPAISK